MNRLQRRFGPDGLVVIAVNVDRERADAERFLQTYPANFRIVFPRSVTVAAGRCVEAGMLATFAMLQGRDAEAFLDGQDVRYWCLR